MQYKILSFLKIWPFSILVLTDIGENDKKFRIFPKNLLTISNNFSFPRIIQQKGFTFRNVTLNFNVIVQLSHIWLINGKKLMTNYFLNFNLLYDTKRYIFRKKPPSNCMIVIIYLQIQEPYPDIHFYIHLRRKTLFYVVNLIIPCVGISFLSGSPHMPCRLQ